MCNVWYCGGVWVAVTEVNHEHAVSRKLVPRLMFEPWTDVAGRGATKNTILKLRSLAWLQAQLAAGLVRIVILCHFV